MYEDYNDDLDRIEEDYEEDYDEFICPFFRQGPGIPFNQINPPPFGPSFQGPPSGAPGGAPFQGPPSGMPFQGPPSEAPFLMPPPGAPGGAPFQGPPSGMPFQGPPFGMPFQGPASGPPSGPPPEFEPNKAMKGAVGPKAVDPRAIRRCTFRFVYIWPDRGRGFWAFLVYVGPRSVSGWRWNGRRWVYFGMDLRRIDSFECY